MSPVRLRLGLPLVCVHSPKTKGEVTVIVKPALLACTSKFLSFSHFSRFLSSRRRDDGDDGDNDAMIDTILFLFTESTCFLTSQHAHRFFGTCDAAVTYIFFLSQPFSCTAAAVIKIVMIIFLNRTAKRNTTTSSADVDVTVIHKKYIFIFSRTKQNIRRHDDDHNDDHHERERRRREKSGKVLVCLRVCHVPMPRRRRAWFDFSSVCWSSALDLALCIVMMKRCSQGFWCEDDDVLCM